MCERTARALRGGDGTGPTASLTPDEVDEARIVATWLDSHDARTLDLSAGSSREALGRFLTGAQRADDLVRDVVGAPREVGASEAQDRVAGQL